MLLIGAFGTVLEAIYQVFLASISSRYGAKSVFFEDLCLIQTGVGNKAGPGVYGAAPYQAYGSLAVQRRAE